MLIQLKGAELLRQGLLDLTGLHRHLDLSALLGERG